MRRRRLGYEDYFSDCTEAYSGICARKVPLNLRDPAVDSYCTVAAMPGVRVLAGIATAMSLKWQTDATFLDWRQK